MPSLSSPLDSFHRQHPSYRRIDVKRSRVEDLRDTPAPAGPSPAPATSNGANAFTVRRFPVPSPQGLWDLSAWKRFSDLAQVPDPVVAERHESLVATVMPYSAEFPIRKYFTNPRRIGLITSITFSTGCDLQRRNASLSSRSNPVRFFAFGRSESPRARGEPGRWGSLWPPAPSHRAHAPEVKTQESGSSPPSRGPRPGSWRRSAPDRVPRTPLVVAGLSPSATTPVDAPPSTGSPVE